MTSTRATEETEHARAHAQRHRGRKVMLSYTMQACPSPYYPYNLTPASSACRHSPWKACRTKRSALHAQGWGQFANLSLLIILLLIFNSCVLSSQNMLMTASS
jgi:hypothetical protein